MILGIGIDLIRVERMDRWADQPRLISRFFHPEELEAAKSPSCLPQGGRLARQLTLKGSVLREHRKQHRSPRKRRRHCVIGLLSPASRLFGLDRVYRSCTMIPHNPTRAWSPLPRAGVAQG